MVDTAHTCRILESTQMTMLSKLDRLHERLAALAEPWPIPLDVQESISDRLCMGSAYFPDGSTRVDVMREQVKALEWDLGVKAWGR